MLLKTRNSLKQLPQVYTQFVLITWTFK